MVKEGKKYSEILCAVRNERVTEADAGRVEKATALKDLLGISEDISMEIPCMYLANADDSVRDYLEKRVQVEEGIINSNEIFSQVSSFFNNHNAISGISSSSHVTK